MPLTLRTTCPSDLDRSRPDDLLPCLAMRAPFSGEAESGDGAFLAGGFASIGRVARVSELDARRGSAGASVVGGGEW